MVNNFYPRVTASLFVVLFVLGARPASAQNVAVFAARAAMTRESASADGGRPAAGGAATTTPDPVDDATSHEEKVEARKIPINILADQRDIWTSPFRLGKGDTRWLLPSLLTAAALVGTDREVNEQVSRSEDSVQSSKRISNLGSRYALLGASGGFYLMGRIVHDERARETGLLCFEALADQFIVVSALKAATNRERPEKTTGQQDFFDGGKAFPSGHAAASWAFATVVAEQYRDKPLVRWSAFGLATVVSVSRVTALKHSPSDVFVGGLIGYLIGRHVAKRGTTSRGTSSFVVSPIVSTPAHTYGVAGAFTF